MTEFSEGVKNKALPIYRAIAERLRTRILTGEMRAGEQLPSEDVLSRQLGISHLTLRKSLKILAELKLITQSHGKGTFVAYQNEERLRIGVVIGNTARMSGDIYLLRMIAGLSQALNAGMFRGEFIILDSTEVEKLQGQINQHRCDGVISIDNTEPTVAFLLSKISNRLPLVLVNADRRGRLDCCDVCAARGIAGEAVRRLYALGHRKIGCVSGSGDASVLLNNQDFLVTCGELDISGEYLRCDEGIWYDTARQQARELCGISERPTAIVAPGFTFSYAAWEGIVSTGLRIPQDLSFIGFDANRNSNPHMSAMMHSFDKMAAKAVELVFEQHQSGIVPKTKHYEFPAEFVENGSCQKIN